MADTKKITIPIDLSATISNIKDIRSTLTNTLNAAGKDSTLAKTITKEVNKVSQVIGELEEFALSPTIDEKGLKQVETLIERAYKQLRSSFQQVDLSGFEQMASEEDISRLKELNQEMVKLRREREAIKKSGSSERSDAYLIRTSNQAVLNRAQAQKGFDSTAALNKNALAMEKAAESYARTADSLQETLDKTEQEANAAMNRAQTLKGQVSALEAQSRILSADSKAAKFHHAASSFETDISANAQTRNPTISSIESGLRKALESVNAEGKIATDARNAVSSWLREMFPQISTTEAAKMVEKDINSLLRDVMERLFGKGYKNDPDVFYDVSHAAQLAHVKSYSSSEVNRLAAKHSTTNVRDLDAKDAELRKQLSTTKAELTKADNEANRKLTIYQELEDQQLSLQKSAQETRALSQELYTLADAAQTAALAAKQNEMDANEQQQEDVRKARTNSVRGTAQLGGQQALQGHIDAQGAMGEAYSVMATTKAGAAEAEQFQSNLKQSIAHWMSAQQVINLVKDGIRQAYQDIKALDKSMTDIAVVTDMSISDLWGKINDYMAIAQQYGVTTQGVYEVSQLYYQQGLAANDVMAATTETLKLARIAGMDYKDAADAMTVAVRAFKMEMEDASHVTDVYSKVAAITASDSEELAIAMSKTASSAESVGSSFENTTAMLAVMVETTRESAQNLGSALKSIISRYGEMKVGLTIDSEGEEIDYNKVDTALKSVGISIKDAQGQFRDFDDVIFELSKKWDSLDKNTQRYIATIMAGNRQQSRFIALVDNWERLDEVSKAAADSADAGLLQYAKTLDSLETKLNQLSNTFQAFYMEIINGEVVKGFVDILNNAVTSFARLGPIIGGLKLVKLISQIKQIGTLLVNTFSSGIQKVRNASKDWQDGFTKGWPSVGDKIGDFIANGIKNGAKRGVAEATDAALAKTSAGATAQFIQSSPTNEASLLAKKELGTSVLNSYFGQMANIDQSTAEGKAFYNAVLAASDRWTQTNADLTIEEMAALTQRIGETEVAYRKINNEQVGAAKDAAEELKKGAQEAGQSIANSDSQKTGLWSKIKNNEYYGIGQALTGVGTVGSLVSSLLPTDTMAGYDAQGWVNAGSGLASTIGQALTGNIPGAIISAFTTITEAITHFSNRAKVELENAKKAAEEANIERAESKEEYKSLESYTKRLKELNKTRFESNEAQEEWLALNNEMAEKYPELISYIDSEGNSIVNLTAGYEKLSQAKTQALKDNADYWAKERDYQQKQIDQIGNTTFNSTVLDSNAATINTNNLATGIENGIVTSYRNTNGILYWVGNEFLFQPTDASGGWIGNEYSIIPGDEEWAASQFGNGVLSYKTPEDIPDFYKNFFVKSEEYTGSEAYEKILEIFQAQSEGKTIYSLVDSGIDMSGMVSVLSSEEGSALADPFIRTGLVERDSTSGEIELTETGKYVAQLQKDRNLYERTVENFISSTGNLILQTSTVLESISDISGWEELALISSTSDYGGDWRQMNEIDIRTAYEKFADTTKEWYSTLSQKKQDEFNNVLTNLNNYTEEELQRILAEDFGLQETDPIYKAIELKYAEQRRTTVERYAANFGQGEFQSFEAYKADKASVDKTDEELARDYIVDITKNNTDIANLTTKELEAYVNRRLELDALIEDDQNVLWSIFNNQKTLVETAKSYLNDSTLDKGARTELEALISAEDFGTQDWAKRVTAWEIKWDRVLDNTEQIVSESFFTYVDGLLDEIETTLDSFEDIIEKQSKGFTFEEARKLLQRYQKLEGHANASFDDIFEVLEDGTIVLRDLNQVTSDFYAQQAQNLQEQSNQAQQAIDAIQQADWTDTQILAHTSTEGIQWLLKKAGVDPTMISTIMAGIADGTIKTWNDVVEFLKATQEELDAGVEYLNKQYASNRFTSWKTKRYEPGIEIDKWLKGQGTLDDLGQYWAGKYVEAGYNLDNTATFESFIDAQVKNLQGAFVDAAGNLIITDYKLFMEYLATNGIVDETILQQYSDEIEDLATETIVSIFDLISKAIEGTLTATELRDLGQKVVDSGVMSSDDWQPYASKNVRKVGNGYQMNRAAAINLQVSTGRYDFEELVDQFDSFEDVNNILKELRDNSTEWGNAFVDAAERVLESIKMIKAQDPSDAMFNWMDQGMEGWAGTFESMIGSIEKFGTALDSISEDGTIGLKDFYNINQMMKTTGAPDWWEDYANSVYATVTAVDGGQVSLAASGKSMEEVMSAMRDAATRYYQDTAKQQIAFIDQQIAALEAQKKVEDALDGGETGTIKYGDVVITSDEVNEKGQVQAGATGYKLDEEAAMRAWYLDQHPDAEKELSRQQLTDASQQAASTKEGRAEYETWFTEKYLPTYQQALADARALGWDTSDPELAQQIAEAAYARMGIEGYQDLFNTDQQQLDKLTSIESNVAKIADQIAPEDKRTDPVSGVVDNGSGSGNDTPPPYIKPKLSDQNTNTDDENKTNQVTIDGAISIAFTPDNITITGLSGDEAQAKVLANSVLEPLGIKPNEDGTYTYSVTGATMTASFAEDGTLKLDISNATATPPDSTAIFNVLNKEGSGFTGTASNWIYTDSSTGFTYKCTNGIITIDTNTLVPPAKITPDAITAAIVKEGSGWSLVDGVYEYKLGNEVICKYFADSGKIVITAPNGNDPEEISTDAFTNWTSAGDSLWTQPLPGGYTFEYNASSGKIVITAPTGIAPPQGVGPADIGMLITANNSGWSGNGLVYTYSLTGNQGLTCTYYADTGKIIISKPDGTAPEEISTDAFTGWTSPKEGTSIWTKSLPGGYSFQYNSQSQALEILPPTVANDVPLTSEEADAFFKANGWDGTNGVYTKDISYGVLTYNATASQLTIEPADNINLDDVSIDDLIKIAFGEGNYSVENGIYTIAANDGKLVYTVSTTLKMEPAEGKGYSFGNDGTLSGTGAYVLNVSVNPDLTELNNTLNAYKKTVYVEVDTTSGASGSAGSTSNANHVKNGTGSKSSAGSTYGGAGAKVDYIFHDPGVYHLRWAKALGNVSGLAFATGTEKLIAGAHLANKSLVGELGPELAVYNGQYHLLGANGAEFANIPNDAIIFNHKQTEGILKGQANIRGRVKNGGEAFAEGNISGPAYYNSKIDDAIKALQEARSMWQKIASADLNTLINAASGGSGSSAKAYSSELQEWYNLLRQIAIIEADINRLVKERSVLQAKYDGEGELRNLRQQQQLLEKQKTTQEILLKYQNAQLKRQKDQINSDKILSKYITVGEDGTLQYKEGNEENGGKGALEVLANLNTMSAAEQLAYVKSVGFHKTENAYDQDGKLLEGDDLVQAFYDYLDSAIKEYDTLQDTVNETTGGLSDIESKLLDIEDTVRNNQLELEQNIYDTIVDAWEANIEALEEQKDLIEEANDAYVEGLRDALNAERDAYNDDKAIADREQLQRQLSLLRRTGGSASEIADLEEQIDEKLKEEYFDKQEEMVESIEESNARQVELLEEQIKIQEDTLEYQKANGIIWSRVAEIMDGTKQEILAFFQGNTPGFFSQSKEQQISALNDWSYSVGIFKEDQLIKTHSNDFSNGIIGEKSDGTGGTDVWSSEHLSQYKDTYTGLDDSKKTAVSNAYGTAYASAIAEGKTEEEARNAGFEAAAGILKKYKEEKETDPKDPDNTPPVDDTDKGGGGGGKVSITVIAADGLGSPTVNGKTSLKIEPNKTYTIAPNPKPGYEFKERQVGSASIKTTKTFSVSGNYPSLQVKVWYKASSGEETSMLPSQKYGYEILDMDTDSPITKSAAKYSSEKEAYLAANDDPKRDFIKNYVKAYKAYKTGGLVDYTGLAMVHGTPGKPEAFLNAEQTEAFSEIMGASGKTSLLENIKNTLQTLEASIQGTVSSGNALASNSSIVINPGAVVIEVAELSDSYDVESLSNDVMNRLTAIAAKATSRSVNRR